MPQKAISGILLVCLWLAAGYARATVGMAEYSWYFHDQPAQWMEWNHGDICPRDSPGKDCVVMRRSGANRSSASAPEPFIDSVQALYLPTVLAVLPLAVGLTGLAVLWRRWRKRITYPDRRPRRATLMWGFATTVACVSVPQALAILFPANPRADGWLVVILLSVNILIVLAPVTLWWSHRRLFAPRELARVKGWMRLTLWLLLLASSVLAPLLFWGPPNVLMFLFPPLMLLCIVTSLLAVWLASRGYDLLARRASNG